MKNKKITNMATFTCRVQYLDDTDPFSSTNFPEPTRPPTFTFHINVPLNNQIGGVHRLLQAPHKVSEFGLRVGSNSVASVNKVWWGKLSCDKMTYSIYSLFLDI